MALDLLHASNYFRVPYSTNEKVQIRIGIHTGSVGAGKNMKLNSYHKYLILTSVHTQELLDRKCRDIVYLVTIFGINSKLIKNFFNCKTEISQLYSSTGDTINVASRMESTGEGKNTFPNSTTALSSFKFPLRQLQKSTSHPR